MTPAERTTVLTRILAQAIPVLADPASPPDAITYCRDALRKVTALIDSLHHLEPEKPGRTPERTAPHDARAHAREPPPALIADATRIRRNEERAEAGLHGIRKGRRPCEARNRDGSPCKAPAIPGAAVCRRHGGSAPQVRIAAGHMQLLIAHADAIEAHQAAQGSPAEFDALCAWSRAKNELDEYEAKLTRLRELRASARQARKQSLGGHDGHCPRAPPVLRAPQGRQAMPGAAGDWRNRVPRPRRPASRYGPGGQGSPVARIDRRSPRGRQRGIPRRRLGVGDPGRVVKGQPHARVPAQRTHGTVPWQPLRTEVPEWPGSARPESARPAARTASHAATTP